MHSSVPGCCKSASPASPGFTRKHSKHKVMKPFQLSTSCSLSMAMSNVSDRRSWKLLHGTETKEFRSEIQHDSLHACPPNQPQPWLPCCRCLQRHIESPDLGPCPAWRRSQGTFQVHEHQKNLNTECLDHQIKLSCEAVPGYRMAGTFAVARLLCCNLVLMTLMCYPQLIACLLCRV